jgi:hypothetical protein
MWRSSPHQPSENPTSLLFHCTDAHGLAGRLPNFEAGESWRTLHDAAHAAEDSATDRGEVTKGHEHGSP